MMTHEIRPVSALPLTQRRETAVHLLSGTLLESLLAALSAAKATHHKCIVASAVSRIPTTRIRTDSIFWITCKITRGKPFVQFVSTTVEPSIECSITSLWCTARPENWCAGIQLACSLLGLRKIWTYTSKLMRNSIFETFQPQSLGDSFLFKT